MDYNINLKKFKQEQMTFLNKEKVSVSMIGLAFRDKIFQVRLREGWIRKNDTEYKRLENSQHPKASKIKTFIEENTKELENEIEMFKYAAFIDKQGEIYSSQDFQDRNNLKEESEKNIVMQFAQVGVEETGFNVVDTLNEIISIDPQLFTNFTVEAMKKSTPDTVIPVLKEVAEHHGMRVSKKPIIKSK